MENEIEKEKLIFYGYCRKSSEEEDRQMLSLDSQKKSIGKVAEKQKLKVAKVYSEAKSAYKTGREEFNEMIGSIEKGKSNAILTYHLTRLARNMLDGGRIIYMLDLGQIKMIVTPEKTYRNTSDDKFVMSIDFAMAKKSSDDTSNFVKRDITAKLEKGEYPCFAPIGYLNIDKDQKISGKQFDFEKQGKLLNLQRPLKRVELDPFLAPIIKQMCELNSTGQYTMNTLREMSLKMGLLANRSKKKISKATIHRMLINPFYYGAIRWRGKIIEPEEMPFKTRHEPIITKELYERNLEVLGLKSKQKANTTTYPYSNFIKCGVCNGTISGMTAKGHHYYRCVRCGKPTYIREEELEEQVFSEIEKISIDESFLKLAIEELNKANEIQVQSLKDIRKQQERALQNCKMQMENLIKLKITATNIDGGLLSDDEFIKQKREIMEQEAETKRGLEATDGNTNQWFDTAVDYFDFTTNLKNKFPTLSPEKKREVFQFICINPILTNKIMLNIEKNPHKFIIELKVNTDAIITANLPLTKTKTEVLTPVIDDWRSLRDDFRTLDWESLFQDETFLKGISTFLEVSRRLA